MVSISERLASCLGQDFEGTESLDIAYPKLMEPSKMEAYRVS
jgi:hypothetical protein